jgi:hypothetical protein
MRWVGRVGNMERMNAYSSWVMKSNGKKSLGRCSYRWKDNIKKMDLRLSVGW